MLQTRSYEMCRSSGNLIQWRKSLFDTILVYNNKNKPMLRYKFGSVYYKATFFFFLRFIYEKSHLDVKHDARKSSGFPTRSDTNRAVQAKEMARGWKFLVYKVEELYFPCSENRGADQLRTASQLLRS